jgi:type IV pilus assembly protein PilV
LRGRRGFTLIEALIAMFVLTIGLLGCASLLSWSLIQGGAALRREIALGVAAELIGRMRAQSNAPDAAQLAEWRAQLTTRLPSLQTSIEVFPPPHAAALERIDVTVRWSEPRAPGGVTSIVLRTYRRPSAEPA